MMEVQLIGEFKIRNFAQMKLFFRNSNESEWHSSLQI